MSTSIENSDNLERTHCRALDGVLGKKFKVLDDGFIRVVDYMGTDASIVQAARVSYGAGTKRKQDDRSLIRYLMRHDHTTPFEMCELKLHVRVPMDCWRQWIRHRTASVNEYSTRYSEAIDVAQVTAPNHWRAQSTANKQGSESYLSPAEGEELSLREKAVQKVARDEYQDRLSRGVAREQARKDLPLSTYTEAYWKINLRNLLHFLSLRMDAHAQLEIRDYANIIGHEIVARWCPVAWEAFVEYKVSGLSLTKLEIDAIRLLLAGVSNDGQAALLESGQVMGEQPLKPGRERDELDAKLKVLGFAIPWQQHPMDSK